MGPTSLMVTLEINFLLFLSDAAKAVLVWKYRSAQRHALLITLLSFANVAADGR
jgi:hypothetical protein